MKAYLESVISSIVDVFNEHPGVTVETSIADVAINPKRAIAVGIIVNELLTNVFKHAFRARSAGRVAIDLEKRAARVTLTVRDDGVGLAEQAAKRAVPGFGLTIVTMLAEQLEGTFAMAQ